MFDRYKTTDKAILVHFVIEKNNEETLAEFKALTLSANIEIIHIFSTNIKTAHPKYFIGHGKAEEIAKVIKNSDATMALFNTTLSVAQERNLEKVLDCRVIDRTGLILNIFAQRAQTYEGKLQVELAQLKYLSTRLVRGWTHLERQKGGIGLRGGPGEKQLEIDRRLLRKRMGTLLSRLNSIVKQRQQSRKLREHAAIPTLSLVGYTNAGKSTLFNCLSRVKSEVADKLFATLDPMVRRIIVPNLGKTVLADTVGFVSNLPHELVLAFKATLQETLSANLLLHVVDVSSENSVAHVETVKEVLDEIGAINIPTLIIMNKIDILSVTIEPHIDRNEKGEPWRVWLSANSGEGISLLLQAIAERLQSTVVRYDLCFPPEALYLLTLLYNQQAIEKEQLMDNGDIKVTVVLPNVKWHQLCKSNQKVTEYIIK